MVLQIDEGMISGFAVRLEDVVIIVIVVVVADGSMTVQEHGKCHRVGLTD